MGISERVDVLHSGEEVVGDGIFIEQIEVPEGQIESIINEVA